jgi:hypothetical protein
MSFRPGPIYSQVLLASPDISQRGEAWRSRNQNIKPKETAETRSTHSRQVGEFSLHCTSRNCSQAAMKFSCRKTDKFVDIRLVRGQQRRRNTVALPGDLPPVSVRNLANESVGMPQSQWARDVGRLRQTK